MAKREKQSSKVQKGKGTTARPKARNLSKGARKFASTPARLGWPVSAPFTVPFLGQRCRSVPGPTRLLLHSKRSTNHRGLHSPAAVRAYADGDVARRSYAQDESWIATVNRPVRYPSLVFD